MEQPTRLDRGTRGPLRAYPLVPIANVSCETSNKVDIHSLWEISQKEHLSQPDLILIATGAVESFDAHPSALDSHYWSP